VSVDSLDRHELIRRRLDVDGRVRVTDLADVLGVSEMTVRRDLDALVEEGVAQRVHGGAIAVGPQEFAARRSHHSRAKARIADKLLELVGAGGAIGIDASSTMQHLATRLGGVRDLTVITNGPDAFRSLQEHPGVTALLTGGQLDPRTGSLVGPLAARAARDVLVRRLFVSAAALDVGVGSSETTLEDAEAKRALADSAAEVVLAVDASKLHHRAAAAGFRLDEVSVLVTDLDPSDHRLNPFRDAVPLV
jgi:DeoR family transcriptional regulator, fructose operon transcriptional repressor